MNTRKSFYNRILIRKACANGRTLLSVVYEKTGIEAGGSKLFVDKNS